MTKTKKRSWLVKLRVTVTREVVTQNCTEEAARCDPYMYFADERELGTEDYEVLSVEPNE